MCATNKKLIADKEIWKMLLADSIYNADVVDNYNKKKNGGDALFIQNSFMKIFEAEIFNRYKNHEVVEIFIDYIYTFIWDNCPVNEVVDKIFEILAEDES